MTFARLSIARIPRLNATAALIALAAIVGVPVLAFNFPRWAARLAMPLLAITSVGVYLTVPDTERVILVMALVVIAGVVCLDATITVAPWLVAATALLIMGTAILDSAGRAAAIVRAAGCFGVLLVLPVAERLQMLRSGDGGAGDAVGGGAAGDAAGGGAARRPALVTVALVHCLVVGWSSRVLIRETAVGAVLLGTGGALVAATLLLFATARRVPATP